MDWLHERILFLSYSMICSISLILHAWISELHSALSKKICTIVIILWKLFLKYIDFCRLAVLFYIIVVLKYATYFGVIRASNRDLQQLLYHVLIN